MASKKKALAETELEISTNNTSTQSKAKQAKPKIKGLYGDTTVNKDDFVSPTKKRETAKAKTLANKRLNQTKAKANQQRLLDAIELLQSLGFKIDISSNAEDLTRQEESLKALGIVRDAPIVKSKPKSTHLTAVLKTRHMLGGEVYGPGEIKLNLDQDQIFRTLIEQDQKCVRAHQDSKDYKSETDCFIIQRGKGQDQHNKFSKIQISAEDFNDASKFLGNTAFTVGKKDLANRNVF